LWGAGGKEYIKAISSLCEYNLDDSAFGAEDAEKATLLSAFQGDILNRRLLPAENCKESLAENSAADDSLRFWQAPTIRREVESIASDIRYKLLAARKRGEELSFADIAIVLPGGEAGANYNVP
jgi:exonuclease V gamma subunit